MIVVKSYSFETIITNSINQGYCTLYHLSSKFKALPTNTRFTTVRYLCKMPQKKPTTYCFTFFYVYFKVKRTRIPSFCGAFSFEIKHKLKLVVYSLHYIFCLSAQLYFILTFFPLNQYVKVLSFYICQFFIENLTQAVFHSKLFFVFMKNICHSNK